MIIKSMSRKQAGLKKLFMYLDAQACDRIPVFWNMNFSPLMSSETVYLQFQEQLRRLKPRQRGNCLYHEIISLKKQPKVSSYRMHQALVFFIYEYLHERAQHMRGYARLHEQPHHLHFHLVLTANSMGDSKPVRLSKARFREIQQGLERKLLQKFPELEHEPIFALDLLEQDWDLDR